jgi:predicted ATPase
MPLALAHHDALVRAAVESNRGVVVKMIGDGVHAAFDEPLDALNATLAIQQALTDARATNGVALQVRCGLHAGAVERRDNDYFGSTLNRAARIMAAAHGGQVLLSKAVATLVGDGLPASVALRDLGSVRLRDLASPERVYQVVHPQLRQKFPALRSLESTPNNLPQQVSSFIGRERELAAVKALLGTTRLLTLVGVGGIGKTRLSLQVAADVMDDYSDGVWFVELAPFADARLVPQAVASILGVKEEAGHPVLEALLKYVKDRQLLLVLDNCEHLLYACADLGKQLLQSGPEIRIVASSREHLHVAGEASYPVPSLETPTPQTTVSASLMQYEAARLFIDRAVAAKPSFHVTHENAAAISDVCHRLDGIPLAIELAAARVRALSVREIATRLSDRFRLLAGGDRTALPRQQTLRASIDWSYDLLTKPERGLLQRLAVFAGGWTLEGAEAVGVGGDVDKVDVLELLVQLVEKSLVALEAEGGRYRLLETVRQYAQERLNDSGEGAEACARHLAFYVALVENARPKVVGPEQGTWLAHLDVERENLLAAHAWCDRTEGGAELGLRLAHAVQRYWFNRGLLGLGYRVTLEALARTEAQERSVNRFRGLYDAAQLGFFMGRYEEAQGYLEESLAIARGVGDKGRVAASLALLGVACLGHEDLAKARGYLEEALILARELGDKVRLASALNALAELHRTEGKLDTAEPLYEESLVIRRERGDREAIAIELLNLAVVSIGRGSGDRAREALLEALSIIAEIGSKRLSQAVLDACAGLGAFRGHWERAARFYGASEAQMEQMGLHREPADEAFLAPLIAKARRMVGAAAFAAAEFAARALSYEEAMLEAREWLASAH